ncbi:conserved hypothetical protein [[Clostridium] ultunense Esp]|uniref:DUF1657 domain-containing protein n=1 Tax=Thermicanus aegyptius TaxID=94009 RepID=UPI0002B70FEC|nr:DUF1657 domain-containing protein [Thermicanus aegyptius]CCQ95515.1 conserved hypothetical protein [[Clostridium] ultunense Esp]
MTVATQLQQTIASIQSAAATLKNFSLQTQDQQAKQQFQQLAKEMDNAVQSLQQRQQYIEGQEPQYRQS